MKHKSAIFSVYYKTFYKRSLLFKFKFYKNEIYLQNNLTKHLSTYYVLSTKQLIKGTMYNIITMW